MILFYVGMLSYSIATNTKDNTQPLLCDCKSKRKRKKKFYFFYHLKKNEKEYKISNIFYIK